MKHERTHVVSDRITGSAQSPWTAGSGTLSLEIDTEQVMPDIRRSIQTRAGSQKSSPRHDGISTRRLLANLPPTPSNIRFVTLSMFLADAAAIAISCGVAGFVASRFFNLSLHQLGAVSLSLAIPILLGNLLAGLYPGVALNPVVEFRQLSRTTAISFLGVMSLACLGRFGLGWYLFIALAAPLQFLIAPLSRAWVRASCCGRKWWGYPVMIFGSGDAATTVVLNLLQHPAYGLRPAIVVDPVAKVQTVMGLHVVNRPRLTSALAKRMGIRHAIVVLPDLSREQATRVLERHAKSIRHVMITSAISPFAPGLPILWRDTRDLAGVAGVEVRNRLLVAVPRMIKRTMDLVLTVSGGLCILPLIATLAVLVKFTSRGPIFYGHTRIGERGRRFSAWKFRSMVIDGDALLQAHLAANPEARDEWERDQKLKSDPRVTRVGAIIRKTSLDELPQLWNVLKGEMSLVGPRPIVNAEIEKYGRCYKIYKAVRPGITGLWQVSGRNDTTYEERLRHDEFYVRNWSPWLDMHILARTVATLICGRGAY